jgi:hypothetical protein
MTIETDETVIYGANARRCYIIPDETYIRGKPANRLSCKLRQLIGQACPHG